MALIKHSQARDLARDAIVLDLGDLQRQAAAIAAQAQVQAKQIVDTARAERERILVGAADQGREKGHAQGLAEGRRAGEEAGRAAAIAEVKPRLEAIEAAWKGALEGFEREREELLSRAQRDVLRLAVAIAERVTKRVVRLDPGVATEQLRAVLGLVVRPTALTVAIHPADREVLSAALPGLLAAFPSARHVELVEDGSLAPGSCVARTRGLGAADAETGGGEIDASIDTQLGRIVEALLPGRAGAEAEGRDP